VREPINPGLTPINPGLRPPFPGPRHVRDLSKSPDDLLNPGVTVILARIVVHERFSLAQRTGLGPAAIAVAAIALN
jgi:hypothetical protein